jgi:hypothetical protein
VPNLVFTPQPDNLSTWNVMNGAKIEDHIDASTPDGFKQLIEYGVNDSGDNSLMSWFDRQYMPAVVSEEEKSKFDVVFRLDIEISNPFKLDEGKDDSITFSSLQGEMVVSPLLYLLIISCIGKTTYEKSIIWLIKHYSLMIPRCIQKTPGISRDSASQEDSKKCYPELYFIGEMLKRRVSTVDNVDTILEDQLIILMLLLSKDQLLLERFDYDSTTKLHALTPICEAIQQFNRKKLKSRFSATLSKISTVQEMMDEINAHRTTYNLTEEKLTAQKQVLPKYVENEIERMALLSREINHNAKEELYKMEQDRIEKEQSDRERKRHLDAFKLAQQRNDFKEAVLKQFAEINHDKPVVTLSDARIIELQAQYVIFLQRCTPVKATKLVNDSRNLYTELMELYPEPITSYVQKIQREGLDFLMSFKHEFCRNKQMRFAFLINNTNHEYRFEITHLTQHNLNKSDTQIHGRPILLLPNFGNPVILEQLNKLFERYNMKKKDDRVNQISDRKVNYANHYEIYEHKIKPDSSDRLYDDTGFKIYFFNCQ